MVRCDHGWVTYPEPDQQPRVPAEDDVVRDRAAQRRADRDRVVGTVCSAISFLCGLFAVVLALKVLLTLAGANPDNGFASFVDDFAAFVLLGFNGLFTPESAKLAVLFNYGTAAIAWLLIGAVLTSLIRRFAAPVRRR
jgi:hypothetical protein